MFKTADRYILRQIVTPLVTAISIGMFMLLAERMVRLLDSTLGKRNSLVMVFEMLGYLVPHYLGVALPASLFLGLLFGFSKMSKNSEIDAFMAAGIGLHRLVRPVAFLSLAFLLASLFVFGWMQPFARYAYRAIVFEVQNIQIFYLAEEGVFMQAANRTFILDKLDRDKSAFRRIFVYTQTTDGEDKSAEVLTAARGALVDVPGEVRPVLHLLDGRRMTFSPPPVPGKPAVSAPKVTDFAVADTPIGRNVPDVYRPRGGDERELTLPELFRFFEAPPGAATHNSMVSEINKRIIQILTLPILPYLALPFTVGHRRSQRTYRFGAALVLIIAYFETVEQGSLAVKVSGLSPITTLWLPWSALLLFTAWRFYKTAFTLRADLIESAIERLNDLVIALRAKFARRRGQAGAS